MFISLDNGGTIDVRLVTEQGESTTNKSETESVMQYSRLETPSPSVSNESNDLTSSTSNKLLTFNKSKSISPANITTPPHDEHTYVCNKLLADEKDVLNNELAANIILHNSYEGYSLRRFFPDNPNLGKI